MNPPPPLWGTTAWRSTNTGPILLPGSLIPGSLRFFKPPIIPHRRRAFRRADPKIRTGPLRAQSVLEFVTHCLLFSLLFICLLFVCLLFSLLVILLICMCFGGSRRNARIPPGLSVKSSLFWTSFSSFFYGFQADFCNQFCSNFLHLRSFSAPFRSHFASLFRAFFSFFF